MTLRVGTDGTASSIGGLSRWADGRRIGVGNIRRICGWWWRRWRWWGRSGRSGEYGRVRREDAAHGHDHFDEAVRSRIPFVGVGKVDHSIAAYVWVVFFQILHIVAKNKVERLNVRDRNEIVLSRFKKIMFNVPGFLQV